MTMLRFVFVITFFVLAVSPAFADEFGARFGNEAPSAFDDPSPEQLARSMALSPEEAQMMMAAESMQDIMPAAGDDFEEPQAEDTGAFIPDIDF